MLELSVIAARPREKIAVLFLIPKLHLDMAGYSKWSQALLDVTWNNLAPLFPPRQDI
jgi:hypothetical protein